MLNKASLEPLQHSLFNIRYSIAGSENFLLIGGQHDQSHAIIEIIRRTAQVLYGNTLAMGRDVDL